MSAARHGRFAPGASAAERLVVGGFRAWMAGYDTGDIGYWETAWNDFAAALGPEMAKPAVTALSGWVKTVRACSARQIQCFAFDCAAFCKDECAALALVSACQHRDQCQARAAAFLLTGLSASVDPTVASADRFAAALDETGQRLRPLPECRACHLFAGPWDNAAKH